MSKILRVFGTFGMAMTLAGCGTKLPEIDLQHPGGGQFNAFVRAITIHLRCELGQAVQREYLESDPYRKAFRLWAAKIALTLRATDKGALLPNASLYNIVQTRLLGLGASASANATREMTMTYFLTVDELIKDHHVKDEEGKNKPCRTLSDDPIAGDLKITETLSPALESWDNIYRKSQISKGPFDTITHRVSFEVELGATATPTWKLVDVTINPSAPLAAVTRSSANELLITFGPAVVGDRKIIEPSRDLDAAFQVERLRGIIQPTR